MQNPSTPELRHVLIITISASLHERIENYRSGHSLATDEAATEELIEIGLRTAGRRRTPSGSKRARSISSEHVIRQEVPSVHR
jgi:hypothetical protein